MDAADEDLIDEQVDSKDHPLGGAAGAAGLETQLSGDGGWLFLFLLAVLLPDIPAYYFTDDESQYQVDFDDDFEDDLDDLEIDVVSDLGSFTVFVELVGFQSVLLVAALEYVSCFTSSVNTFVSCLRWSEQASSGRPGGGVRS